MNTPIIIPVISNIFNFYQSLHDALERSDLKISIQFLSWPPNECPSKLLSSFESLPQYYPIIISDAYLLTEEFFKALYEQLKDESNHRHVKWIMCTFAGVNLIFDTIRKLECGEHLLELLEKRNVKLTKIGTFGLLMYEYLLQHMLNDLRFYDKVLEHQSQKLWIGKTAFLHKTLNQVKIGLMGFGNIGKYVTHQLKQSFPKITIHVYRNQKSYCNTLQQENHDNHRTLMPDKFFYGPEELQNFLSSTDFDFIISILPSTPQTRKLLDNEMLKHLTSRSHTCFINVGRGDLISESSVIAALDDQYIRKAILDVFEVEPLPNTSLFWNRKDVLVTPHISALSIPSVLVESFVENFNLIAGHAVECVEDLDFNLLKYGCDWKKGY
ncbi:hypothetical protein C9374_005508 [Naegleria lovaniensis]|uniref:D-isomer specific 2-hydroxyacid dehydrogenase NAD-binding domain-containing protein n=1 Tax=Naegleria lovaniensis TaxID=51637 RepID=A0AA88GJV4_NAELO|nr:uncharacterized protein C9374_005508 [Naegleria lovaniensis]KAG2382306.1 hypothetical protein C9374_005508 [Naegleria lovaniensis]